MSALRSISFALSLSLLASLSLASFSGPVSLSQEVEETSPSRLHSLKLQGGKTLKAAILERDGSRYRLEISVAGGGTSIGWYQFADFEASSQVKLLESQVGDDDILAQLEVAEFAFEQGLIEIARKELRRCSHMADSADPARLATLRPRAVDFTAKLVEAYCDMGKVSEARAGVSRILTRKGDRLTQEQKDRLVQALEAGSARQSDKKAAERQQDQDEKTARERTKKLAPVYKELEQGEKLRRDGLLASDSYTKASRILERAVRKFESVLHDVEKLRERFAEDQATLVELDAIAQEAIELGKDTLLANASLDLARGKFSDAMGAVNRILAQEPQNQQALAMRARIEVAENDWGW